MLRRILLFLVVILAGVLVLKGLRKKIAQLGLLDPPKRWVEFGQHDKQFGEAVTTYSNIQRLSPELPSYILSQLKVDLLDCMERLMRICQIQGDVEQELQAHGLHEDLKAKNAQLCDQIAEILANLRNIYAELLSFVAKPKDAVVGEEAAEQTRRLLSDLKISLAAEREIALHQKRNPHELED